MDTTSYRILGDWFAKGEVEYIGLKIKQMGQGKVVD